MEQESKKTAIHLQKTAMFQDFDLEDIYLWLEQKDTAMLDEDMLFYLIEKSRVELKNWLSSKNYVFKELTMLKAELVNCVEKSNEAGFSSIKKHLKNTIYSYLFVGI